MPRTLQKTSFIGGEISPAFNGRVDTQRYYESCKTLQNFIVKPEGGVCNRPGTEYLGAVKTASASTRLIPFINSTTQAYVLEFGNLYFRVWKDGVYVSALGDVTTKFATADLFELNFTQNADTMYITHPNYIPQKITSTGDTSWTIGGVVLGPDPAADVPTEFKRTDGTPHYAWCLTAVDSNGVESDPSNPDYGTAAGGCTWNAPTNGAPDYYRLYRQVDDADQHRLNKDSGIYGWITDIDGQRTGYVIPADLEPASTDRPPEYFNRDRLQTAKDITAVSAHDPLRLTITGHPYSTGDLVYLTNLMDNDSPTEPLEISHRRFVVTKIDANTVSLDDEDGSTDHATFADSGAGNDLCQQYYQKFSEATTSPSVCAWYQQRLLYAASGNKPHTIWGSNLGHSDLFLTHKPIVDDDCYEHEIDAITQNAIVGMVPLEHLLVFTSSAEWVVSGAAAGAAITPTSVNARVQSNYGSADVHPIVVGDNVLFVQYGAKKIRQMAYTTEGAGYRGGELTILASHLFEDTTIVDWAYQREPFNVVWVVLANGKMVGLSYHPEHGVIAWHKHETDGSYESVCVVPDGAGSDDLYMIVNRTIDGSTARYIEKMMSRLPDSDIDQAHFLDSASESYTPLDIENVSNGGDRYITITGHGLVTGDWIRIRDMEGLTDWNGRTFHVVKITDDRFYPQTQSGSHIYDITLGAYVAGTGTVTKLITAISGLSHLEGEEVTVSGDGSVETGLTVSSGAITLTNAASRVLVGLPYTSICETTDFVFKGRKGTTRDKCKQIPKVTVEIEKTTALQVGPDSDNLQTLPFRTDEAYDLPIALFTGTKEVLIAPGDGVQSSVYIKNDKPAPVTILGIMPQIEVGEG